jgi:Tfp pilus assembly protein PilO
VNSNRIWVIGSVTVMIIVLLAGWFLGVEPNLAAAAASDTERVGIEGQNAAKQAEIAALTEQNKNLDDIEAQYKELQKSIPASSNTAAFITGLDGLAASAGVQVVGITVGTPKAYTVPASAAAAAAAANAPAPDPSSTAVPAPPIAVGSVAATSPLITPDDFVGIDVGVDLVGSYQAVLSFVNGLQSGSRLVLVTGFTSTANADTADVTAHIDGMIYVIKQAPAAN